MKERPLKHSDSFWGDLANAIALRPVFRRTVEAPQAAESARESSTEEPDTVRHAVEVEVRTGSNHEIPDEASTASHHEIPDEAREVSTTPARKIPRTRYLKRWSGGEIVTAASAGGDKHIVGYGERGGKKVPDAVRTFSNSGVSKSRNSTSPYRKSQPTGIRGTLTASQLRKLGFSTLEAHVLEGLFLGRSFKTIAFTAPFSPRVTEVRKTISSLSTRFGHSNPVDLCNAIWDAHEAAYRWGLETTMGILNTATTDDSTPMSVSVTPIKTKFPASDFHVIEITDVGNPGEAHEKGMHMQYEGKPNPARNNDYPNVSGT